MGGRYTDSADPGRTPYKVASGRSLHCMRECQKGNYSSADHLG